MWMNSSTLVISPSVVASHISIQLTTIFHEFSISCPGAIIKWFKSSMMKGWMGNLSPHKKTAL